MGLLGIDVYIFEYSNIFEYPMRIFEYQLAISAFFDIPTFNAEKQTGSQSEYSICFDILGNNQKTKTQIASMFRMQN